MRYVVMQAVQQLENEGYDPEVGTFPELLSALEALHGMLSCSQALQA